MEKRIKSSGWQAAVAIVIFAILSGYLYIRMTESLESEGVEVLKTHLYFESYE